MIVKIIKQRPILVDDVATSKSKEKKFLLGQVLSRFFFCVTSKNARVVFNPQLIDTLDMYRCPITTSQHIFYETDVHKAIGTHELFEKQ